MGKNLFFDPKPLIESRTVTNIMCIDDDRILVSTNGIKTCVYQHSPQSRGHFKLNIVSWELIAQLTELDYQRILKSMLGKDYMILANDDCHYWMFDIIGFKLMDKGYVRNY